MKIRQPKPIEELIEIYCNYMITEVSKLIAYDIISKNKFFYNNNQLDDFVLDFLEDKTNLDFTPYFQFRVVENIKNKKGRLGIKSFFKDEQKSLSDLF